MPKIKKHPAYTLKNVRLIFRERQRSLSASVQKGNEKSEIDRILLSVFQGAIMRYCLELAVKIGKGVETAVITYLENRHLLASKQLTTVTDPDLG